MLKMHMMVLAGMIIGASPAFAKTQIVVDIPATAAILQALEVNDANGFEVSILLEPDQSLHHFSLKPSQAQMLEEANWIFGIGSVLSPEIVKAAKNLNPNPAHIWFYDDDGLRDDHDAAPLANCDLPREYLWPNGTPPVAIDNNDPHIWLSRTHLLQMGHAISLVLDCNIGPLPSDTDIMQNLLEDLPKAQTHNPVSLMAWHDAFGYYERENAIETYGAFHDLNDQEISPRDYAKRLEALEAGKVKCLLTDPEEVSSDQAEIAKKYNLDLVVFDILGWRYLEEGAYFPAFFDALNGIYETCN